MWQPPPGALMVQPLTPAVVTALAGPHMYTGSRPSGAMNHRPGLTAGHRGTPPSTGGEPLPIAAPSATPPSATPASSGNAAALPLPAPSVAALSARHASSSLASHA